MSLWVGLPQAASGDHSQKMLRELSGEHSDKMALEELRDGAEVACTIHAVHYALLRMGITY